MRKALQLKKGLNREEPTFMAIPFLDEQIEAGSVPVEIQEVMNEYVEIMPRRPCPLIMRLNLSQEPNPQLKMPTEWLSFRKSWMSSWLPDESDQRKGPRRKRGDGDCVLTTGRFETANRLTTRYFTKLEATTSNSTGGRSEDYLQDMGQFLVIPLEPTHDLSRVWRFVVVYLDEILVFSPSEDQVHLRLVKPTKEKEKKAYYLREERKWTDSSTDRHSLLSSLRLRTGQDDGPKDSKERKRKVQST